MVDKLSKKLFEKAKDKFEDMEVFYEKNKVQDISIYKGEVDNYSISETEGISFRGKNASNLGYSYSERVDESSLDFLIDEAYENSKSIDSKEEEDIQGPSLSYKDIRKDMEVNKLKYVLTDDKIEFLKKLEKEALGFSEKINSIVACGYRETNEYKYIRNTKGLSLQDRDGLGYVYLSVSAKDGDQIKVGSSYEIARDLADFDYKSLAMEASREAISLLGASSVKSGNYRVLFDREVVAVLLDAFNPMFIAENVQRNLSLLKGRLGEEIASTQFSLVEDPFLKDGLNSRVFDDEGVATDYKEIVKDGVLKTYYYNSKTAKKDGVKSTGNGYRSSFKTAIGTSHSNIYMKAGELEVKEVLKKLNNGIMITSVQGTHAGINTVSGDYSLSAYGYEVRDGKIFRPVDQITIAGNFLDLIRNIEAVASDLRFTIFGVGAPSILVGDIAISGD